MACNVQSGKNWRTWRRCWLGQHIYHYIHRSWYWMRWATAFLLLVKGVVTYLEAHHHVLPSHLTPTMWNNAQMLTRRWIVHFGWQRLSTLPKIQRSIFGRRCHLKVCFLLCLECFFLLERVFYLINLHMTHSGMN